MDRFVIGCFVLKENLRHVDTLKGFVGTWVIFVLADDPYTYLNAKNIHSAFFFFLQFGFVPLHGLVGLSVILVV